MSDASRECQLRRAVARSGCTLHKRRVPAANWSSRPWYIKRNEDGLVIAWEVSIAHVEAWLAAEEAAGR
jgi:hypothetical protein